MVQPLRPLKHSGHHPSEIEQFNPPFSGDFIPEVPEASWGRMGLLSQTSQPAVSARPSAMS